MLLCRVRQGDGSQDGGPCTVVVTPVLVVLGFTVVVVLVVEVTVLVVHRGG